MTGLTKALVIAVSITAAALAGFVYGAIGIMLRQASGIDDLGDSA